MVFDLQKLKTENIKAFASGTTCVITNKGKKVVFDEDLESIL